MKYNFDKHHTGIFPYNRKKAYQYMKKWAFSRNNKYYDFENLGGDCTNFVSQILHFAGSPMNYYRWFYRDINNRSPSWTSVEDFYKFLISNKGVGPIGREVSINEVDIGDIIQIKFPEKENYTHSVAISYIDEFKTSEYIYISAHSIDRFDYRLSNYTYDKLRFIAIDGYRVK